MGKLTLSAIQTSIIAKLKKKDTIEYPVHADFKLLFYGVEDYLEQSQAFLTHINSFIKSSEEKLNKTKLYSRDCVDFFYAGQYGNTFRDSFIVTICSFSESYIKRYIEKCIPISDNSIPPLKKESVMDYLKIACKEYFAINIDFNNTSVIDYKGLLALRNTIVHSGSTFEDVGKYKPQIIQLARKYKSIDIVHDQYLFISEQFCEASLGIVKQFFYYLVKSAIQRYYAYTSEKEYWKIDEKNCR